MKRIAVLCSGGVDSAVALSLLREAHNNYDITVFYLKIWLEDELSYLSSCPWEEDIELIKKTCEYLNVPFYQIPLQKEYWEKVVKKSIDMIKNGFTPNPDVFCNMLIKFGSFFDLYGKDFDYIATGHYAKKKKTEEWSYLQKVSDVIKDQTYFLAYTPYNQLKKVIFPLENFCDKSEVRKYAEEKKLPSAKRKDSQGICFLGKIHFSNFVEFHCGKKKGFLIDYESKKIISQHDGFWFYTIGQRHGIGLSGGPWYVVAKNHHENIVYISKKSPALLFKDLIKIKVNYVNYLVPEDEYILLNKEYTVKLRHGEKTNIALICDKIDNFNFQVILKNSDQGIASGQFLVFYNEEGICLGSGIMEVI